MGSLSSGPARTEQINRVVSVANTVAELTLALTIVNGIGFLSLKLISFKSHDVTESMLECKLFE